jgi:hypothetical protein
MKKTPERKFSEGPIFEGLEPRTLFSAITETPTFPVAATTTPGVMIPVGDFGDIMSLVNPDGDAHLVNNNYGDLLLNGGPTGYKVVAAPINSYGEYCGAFNSKNNRSGTASAFSGAFSGSDQFGYWGLENGESPSGYLVIIDQNEDGIGNWIPVDENDFGLGGTLELGLDDIIGSAEITGNTAAWGTNGYLGQWNVTPEPATISLLSLGGLALLVSNKKRR